MGRRRFWVPLGTAVALVFSLACLTLAGCGRGTEALERRVDSLIQRNLGDQAVELVKADLQKSPNDPRLLALLGRSCLALGRIADADSAYARACVQDTNYFRPYVAEFVKRGALWAEGARGDLAESAFQIALAREPGAGSAISSALVAAGARLLPTRASDGDRLFEQAAAYDTSCRRAVAQAYLDCARTLMPSSPKDAVDDLQRVIDWDAALSADVGKVLGDAMAADGKVAGLGAALAARLDPAGRSAFSQRLGGATRSCQVTVAGRDGWRAGPFVLGAGDTLVIEPAGQVQAEARRDGWISAACGPAGWDAKSTDWWEGSASSLRVPSAPRMALVARVGSGPAFTVAARRVVVAEVPGRLMLAVNDVPALASQGAGAFTITLRGPLSAFHENGTGAPAGEVR